MSIANLDIVIGKYQTPASMILDSKECTISFIVVMSENYVPVSVSFTRGRIVIKKTNMYIRINDILVSYDSTHVIPNYSSNCYYNAYEALAGDVADEIKQFSKICNSQKLDKLIYYLEQRA